MNNKKRHLYKENCETGQMVLIYPSFNSLTENSYANVKVEGVSEMEFICNYYFGT